jgi:hypothetical protein
MNEHPFRMDRGGVDCIDCDLPDAEGNHFPPLSSDRVIEDDAIITFPEKPPVADDLTQFESGEDDPEDDLEEGPEPVFSDDQYVCIEPEDIP